MPSAPNPTIDTVFIAIASLIPFTFLPKYYHTIRKTVAIKMPVLWYELFRKKPPRKATIL